MSNSVGDEAGTPEDSKTSLADSISAGDSGIAASADMSNHSGSVSPTIEPAGAPTTATGKPSKSQRRPIACKKCHSLKVKCTPSDEANPAGPCLRCLNSNRVCEIDLNQQRKRRKRKSAAETSAPPADSDARDSSEPKNQDPRSQSSGPLPVPVPMSSSSASSFPPDSIPNLPVPGATVGAPIPQSLHHNTAFHQHATSHSPLSFPSATTHPMSTPAHRPSTTAYTNPGPGLGPGPGPATTSSTSHLPFTSIPPPPAPMQPPLGGVGVALPGTPPAGASSIPLSHQNPLNSRSGESKDDTIKRLEDQVRYLSSELSSSRTDSHRNHSFSQIYSAFSASTPPSTYISKDDLQREISLLCASSNNVLTDLTITLKAASDRKNALIRGTDRVDVISTGLLSMEDARERLEIYRSVIFKRYPLVDVSGKTVEGMQNTEPFLLNAIMSVTNNLFTKTSDMDLSLAIDNEAISSITTEILVAGSKSEELIHSLILLSHWYNTPELFRQRRYHLLNVLSVTMLHDLGIVGKPTYNFSASGSNGGKVTRSKKYPGSSSSAASRSATSSQSEHSAPKGESPYNMSPEELKSYEYKKLIMILYFSTVSICLILRRSIYVKWTPYVEECCTLLENSGVQAWEEMALFSRLCHQLDRIHHILHSPDNVVPQTANGNGTAGGASVSLKPAYSTGLSTSKYVTREFQGNLSQIKDKIRPTDHPFLAYYYSVEAYLHEPMLAHLLTSATQGEDGGLLSIGSVKLSAEAIQAIARCTDSCLNAINQFILMSPSEIATIPLFYSSRIIYTAGMLLRLRYLILSMPQHIEKDLVPQVAVTMIQKLSSSIESAANIYPSNYFLKKIRLVVSLFIQTYATQVQELLAHNGETPENFRPPFSKREQTEMSRLSDIYPPNRGGGSLTHESGKTFPPHISLDVLSYAASVRGSSTSNSPPSLNGGSPRHPTSTQSHQKNTGQQASTGQNGETGKASTAFPSNDKSQGSNNNGISGTSGANGYIGATGVTVPPFGTAPSGLGNPPLPASRPSYLGSILNPSVAQPYAANGKNHAFPKQGFAQDGYQSDMLQNLANANQLETSYMALNDEFWTDILLRTDSEKINFSNGMGNQIYEEPFYM